MRIVAADDDAQKEGAAPVQLRAGRADRLAQSNSMIIAVGPGRLTFFDKTTNAELPSLMVQEAHSVVAVAESGLFYVTQHFYYPTPRVDWAFRAMPFVSNPSSVMTTTIPPKAMTSDGCALYYAADGAISRFKPGPATTDRLTTANVIALAVDDTHVYWTDGTTVKRVLK